jgi:hypothetical protein
MNRNKCGECEHIRFVGEFCKIRGLTRHSYDACKDFKKSDIYSDLKLRVKIGLWFIRLGKAIINLGIN